MNEQQMIELRETLRNNNIPIIEFARKVVYHFPELDSETVAQHLYQKGKVYRSVSGQVEKVARKMFPGFPPARFHAGQTLKPAPEPVVDTYSMLQQLETLLNKVKKNPLTHSLAKTLVQAVL